MKQKVLHSPQKLLPHRSGNLGVGSCVQSVPDCSKPTKCKTDSESVFGQRCIILNPEPKK